MLFLKLRKRKRPEPPSFKFNFERYTSGEALLDGLTSLSAVSAAIFMITRGPSMAVVTVPLAGVALGFFLVRLGFLNSYFSDDILRAVVCVAFITLAFYQFTIGKKEAINILDRKIYRQVAQITTNNRGLDSSICQNAYLGSTPNFIFTLTPNNSVMVINTNQITTMILRNVSDPKKISVRK